jgi:low affinity Fe/Cu permease
MVEFSEEAGGMGRKPHNSFGRGLERLATSVTRWTGGTSAFAIAVATIIIWLVTGPFFGYSDTWQLIINTGTTIVTFLMVFLIQRTQNKDSLAIHLKLNEIVAALDGASNRLIEVESLSEDELNLLRRHYHKLVTMAAHDVTLTKSHSVEEAGVRHRRKVRVPQLQTETPADAQAETNTDTKTDT